MAGDSATDAVCAQGCPVRGLGDYPGEYRPAWRLCLLLQLYSAYFDDTRGSWVVAQCTH